MDEFSGPFIEAVHPLCRRTATVGAGEIKTMPLGDIGNIGLHPRLFFEGVGGPSFESRLKLFKIDPAMFA
jgi:hypothetical protein